MIMYRTIGFRFQGLRGYVKVELRGLGFCLQIPKKQQNGSGCICIYIYICIYLYA